MPGEFVWQPGPLARAVVDGRWVVLENVDMAPPDVVAALAPLLEGGSLTIPARGEVLAPAPGFQLLGSVTTAPGGCAWEASWAWWQGSVVSQPGSQGMWGAAPAPCGIPHAYR